MAYNLRSWFLPGLFFITCALVLSLLVSISLPFLTALDIVRVHYGTATSAPDSDAISQLRFGIWSYCVDNAANGARTCSAKHHGYSVQVQAPNDGGSVTIGSSWTRGLAVHPVAAVITFFAFCASFSEHVTVTLVASLLSFFAALLTLIAFAIDIALFAFVKHEMSDHLTGVDAHTITGPGFWLTFVTLLLLLLAGCTVCFGRRRKRMANANTYQMSGARPWYRRFGRN